MSFFQKEIDRINELPLSIPPELLYSSEARAFVAELQCSIVCWEPWLLKDWQIEAVKSLPLSNQYWETLAMTSAACSENLEQYSELYQRFRDHNEFEFEDFFRAALAMAEKQGFEWEGPMDDLPPTPGEWKE